MPHLYRIRDSITLISQYIDKFTLETFSQDNKTWDAVVKQIENIGEEVNKLERNFLKSYPQLPWSDMIATRNKLVHDYWDINPKRVWEVATIDIPKLRKDLLPILHDLSRAELAEGEAQEDKGNT